MRTLICLALVLSPAVAGAQKSPPVAATFVSTSSSAILAVARLLTEDTWGPIFDQRIHDAPAAKGLGAAWKPSDPRWQKARATLDARMTQMVNAYAGSGELKGHIETAAGKIAPGSDLDAVIVTLKGPAGAALIRQQAKQTYLVHAMTKSPNGPAPGSPEFATFMKTLGRRFTEDAGSGVPADDGKHMADLEKFYSARPLSEVLRVVWDFGVDNATRQLNTALNLMMFDNATSIDRDIASAIRQ